jgi:hypothetical protein
VCVCVFVFFVLFGAIDFLKREESERAHSSAVLCAMVLP